jgi:hypothetical protein
MIVNEFTAYSPTFDCELTRLSMTDELGQEFFTLLPRAEGSKWRKLRAEALEVLSEAIESGLAPGEIRWRRADAASDA